MILSTALLSFAFAQDLTEMVEMRDGVHLATDIFLPEGEGPWPVLLYRTPYGRARLAGRSSAYTPNGVVWVTQDQRGRFDSEGEDKVFGADGNGALQDGYDTAAWIIQQPWSNGKIATTGNSADGIVQYMQAAANPPGLVFMNPEYSTPNFYQDAVFWGGVFRENLAVTWLGGNQSTHFLDTIAAHPYADSFWDSYQTSQSYGDVNTAGLHVSGWFDIFSQGNIDGFVGYQHQGGPGAQGHQKLIMGPWTHTSIGITDTGVASREQGELVFPPNSIDAPFHREDAFDYMAIHYLQLDLPGNPHTIDDIPTVQYYVMGDVDDPQAPGNTWRTAEDWPPEAAPVRYHLHSDGSLAEACPSSEPSSTSYTYDPASPTPSICGNNLNMANGPCDQSPIESRSDVVVFDTPVLTEPVEITGRVQAHLFVDIDQPDADLMVRLTDVYPDGRSMLITDGAARIAARGTLTGLQPYDGTTLETVVDLWSSSIIINTGHRIRISVSSANYPRFAASRNTLDDWPNNTTGAGNPVTVSLHHSGEVVSYIELPDPTRTSFTTCPSDDPGDTDPPVEPTDTDTDLDKASSQCGCVQTGRAHTVFGLWVPFSRRGAVPACQ